MGTPIKCTAQSLYEQDIHELIIVVLCLFFPNDKIYVRATTLNVHASFLLLHILLRG